MESPADHHQDDKAFLSSSSGVGSATSFPLLLRRREFVIRPPPACGYQITITTNRGRRPAVIVDWFRNRALSTVYVGPLAHSLPPWSFTGLERKPPSASSRSRSGRVRRFLSPMRSKAPVRPFRSGGVSWPLRTVGGRRGASSTGSPLR
jgi:hypothetical protein